MKLTVILSISFAAIAAAAPAAEEGEVVLLHVLFRHGNRAPDVVSLFPNDIHKNETYAPFGFSQLTTKGKQTEFEIGKYIRSTYKNFLPKQYTPNVVDALSTNFKRTKMSLELVLASVFPPTDLDKFNGSIVRWQPIPFNIEPGGGLIGVAMSYCANWLTQYYNYVLSDEAQQIIEPYRDLFQLLANYGGYEVNTPRDVGSIYFTLKSEEDFGLSLPSWAKNVYPASTELVYAIDYEFSTATPTLQKYTSGFLLKKILDDTKKVLNGTLNTKLFLYSAHEFNVATMLRTLNVFYRHVPPFGATIYFEIRNINGLNGLRLFYQDYKQTDPRLLEIPNCGTFCPLVQLEQLVKNSLPSDTDTCTYSGEIA